MSNFNQFVCKCVDCGQNTSRVYARKHQGKCKMCVTGVQKESRDTIDKTSYEYIHELRGGNDLSPDF